MVTATRPPVPLDQIADELLAEDGFADDVGMFQLARMLHDGWQAKEFRLLDGSLNPIKREGNQLILALGADGRDGHLEWAVAASRYRRNVSKNRDEQGRVTKVEITDRYQNIRKDSDLRRDCHVPHDDVAPLKRGVRKRWKALSPRPLPRRGRSTADLYAEEIVRQELEKEPERLTKAEVKARVPTILDEARKAEAQKPKPHPIGMVSDNGLDRVRPEAWKGKTGPKRGTKYKDRRI